MYYAEYEDELLLLLRMMKFLHTQCPDAVKRLCEEYSSMDMDELFMVMEEVLWSIFDDVDFDSDEFDMTTLVRCSHDSFDRLYALGRELEAGRAPGQDIWSRRLHDIAEFFVVGAGNSVTSLSQRIVDGHVIFEFGLSPDVYEPLYFGNAAVDMLLYCQRSIERLEAELAVRRENNTLDRREAE